MNKVTKIKTNRELLTEMLGRLHPEADVSDEEVLFSLIYADYEAYAQLIESRESDIVKAEKEGEIRGRNAKIEEIFTPEPPTDGLPTLSGANQSYRPTALTIFDVARGK